MLMEDIQYAFIFYIARQVFSIQRAVDNFVLSVFWDWKQNHVHPPLI